MSLSEFLNNPIGKGDASIPNKSLIIGALSAKYEKYTDGSKGVNKRINMKVFRNAGSDTYYFWLVIPTETERDNTYDVVFKFFDREKKHQRDLSISRYDFQVFTNTPSFAYTYAYVYNNAGLIIPELADKLGKTFYTDSPDVRNRNQNVMYDKYIYFAARYILESKKMNRVVLEAIAKPYDEKYLVSHIRTLDTITNEYRKAEDKLKKKKKAASNHNRVVPKSRTTGSEDNSSIKTIGAKPKVASTVSKAAHRKSPIQKKRGTVTKK